MATVAEEPRPWLRAFLYLVLLSAFFFFSYGFANGVTNKRSYVPSIVFNWERRMPFLAWTIIPYWSSDFLYGVSVLLCRTRRELDRHAKRLIAAQIISVSCFLAFPLRCLYARPETSGVFGRLFEALNGFDRPFNQAPSLHISLAVVLWSWYATHLRGYSRALMGAWLILVGASTMTTWQHQFIDLPTGVLAGALAVALVPAGKVPARRSRRFQLAVFYLSGSLLCAAAALKLGGVGWVLMWPAIALALAAVAYAADWPGIFRMAPLLAPYAAAAWVNSRWWTRSSPAAIEIADGVWLSRAPGWFDRNPKSFRSIVNVSAELTIPARGAAVRNVAMLDLTTPTGDQLQQAVSAIEAFAPLRPTLVCCALGFSRSASSIASWLVWTGRARSADEAIGLILQRRKRIIVHAETGVLIDSFAPSEVSPAPRL